MPKQKDHKDSSCEDRGYVPGIGQILPVKRQESSKQVSQQMPLTVLDLSHDKRFGGRCCFRALMKRQTRTNDGRKMSDPQAIHSHLSAMASTPLRANSPNMGANALNVMQSFKNLRPSGHGRWDRNDREDILSSRLWLSTSADFMGVSFAVGLLE